MGACLRVACVVVVALSACTGPEPSWAPLPPPRPSQPLRPVSYWQAKFNDDEVRTEDEKDLRRSRSSDSWDFYFLSYSIDAYTSMFEATGEARYADAALGYVENMVASARPSSSFSKGQGDQYLGWVSQRPDVRGEEVPLFESYCWRYATRLLRVLRESPLYQYPAYPDRYERLLAFAETNIFEKWYARGADKFIYRSRTHMAAHWAYIALNLSKLTTSDARRARYQEVMRTIDDRLRAQLHPSRTEPAAYWWSDVWGEECTGRGREVCQDVSHGNGMVSYVVAARDLNAAWSAEDVARFSRTFTAFVRGLDGIYPEYINGKGRGNGWIADGFVKLGRYDPAVQSVLQDYAVQDSQYYAAMAVNAKLLGANVPVR